MFNQSLASRQFITLLISSTVAVIMLAPAAFAQTSQFTYQGNLRDSGGPANGSHDFQFGLFDMPTVGAGTQHGPTLTRANVSVSSGSVSVQLDFSPCASCFNGADRFLEIRVKRTSDPTYTTLSPRQQINSAPYALKSVNAATANGLSVACVNCVTSSQIASVNGSAVTGTIPVASVPPGSASYIQNTSSQQASSNFNISGNGVIGGLLTAGPMNVTGFGVGIGTTNPQAGLEINRFPSLRLRDPFTPGSLFEVRANGDVLEILGNGGKINFANAKVGIEQNNPAGQLHVRGFSPVRILGDTFSLEGSEYVDFMARSSIFSSDLGGMRIQRQPATGDIDTLIFAAKSGSSASEMMRVTGRGQVNVKVLQIQGGSDLSENFDVKGSASPSSANPWAKVKPGLVVSIDPQDPGKLIVSRHAYDHRVAGIVSGAGGLKPGMVMGQGGSIADGKWPVALSGRIYCWADASNGPIKPGDLLTSSATPGHAMRAANYAKAKGAIVGKAMTGLRAGRGLVLVLVSLQ